MKSFFEQSEEFKNDVKSLLSNFNISLLYTKDAYDNDYQKIILNGNIVEITIKQERLYKSTLSYKTNTIGEITIYMKDANDNESRYEYNYFLNNILNWEYETYTYRLIVPNEIISKDDVKPFISLLIAHENPIASTTFEQIVYFNRLDGAESLVSKYNLKIENKGE
jgi:hypothetical protein